MILNKTRVKPPRVFYGTEVEHTGNVGMPTVFVCDLVPADVVQRVAAENSHLYFGAGGLSRVALVDVESVLANHPNLLVTIETVDLPHDLLSLQPLAARITVLLPITNNGLAGISLDGLSSWERSSIFKNVYVKVDNALPQVYVVPIEAFCGRMTHPHEYSGDVPIWPL